jgi:uncharacterized protein YegL
MVVSMTQVPYQGFGNDAGRFAENPDPRAPCVLILDVSGSMGGAPIAALNAGLQQYRDEVVQDRLAARRVELAVVTFGGGVNWVQDFIEADRFVAPTLSASGDTPMASAIMRAALELENRKATYRANGISFYRPWMFLFTDGGPTESAEKWQLACDAVRLGEEQKKFTFYPIGVDGADFERLRELSPNRPPLRLNGIAFKEFFKWLSASQRAVSQSQPNQFVQLPPATGPSGWGTASI